MKFKNAARLTVIVSFIFINFFILGLIYFSFVGWIAFIIFTGSMFSFWFMYYMNKYTEKLENEQASNIETA